MTAVKIKLGNRPKDFKRTVTFPMLDGTEGCFELSYKYRTKKEFAELLDKRVADEVAALEAEVKSAENAAEQGAEAAPAAKFSAVDYYGRATSKNVSYLQEIANGWNLDVPFEAEQIEEFANTFPGGMAEAIEKYRAAVVDGRMGN